MEEKKLSKVLDEIFGNYINSNNEGVEETEDIETIKINSAPQIDLNSFIENLFLNKDITNEANLTLSRIPRIECQPAPAIVSPETEIFPKESELKFEDIEKVFPKENEPNFDYLYEDLYKEKEIPQVLRQVYIANAICSQLCELFTGYSKLSRLGENAPVLKNQTMEIMRKAEYIYQKIAGKSVRYTNINVNFNSDNFTLIFIKSKIESILIDVDILEDNTSDLEIKKHLIHIKSFLILQLKTVNQILL